MYHNYTGRWFSPVNDRFEYLVWDYVDGRVVSIEQHSLKSSPKRLQTEGFAPLPGAKDTESP